MLGWSMITKCVKDHPGDQDGQGREEKGDFTDTRTSHPEA
jgi:hypothetical protein